MEDSPHDEQTDPREALRPTAGRDELNLAEFPITLLGDRVPKGCKTLVFEIDGHNKSGEPIKRKVTITGSDAFGLPTATDDQVLVALIQLTKIRNDFTDPRVTFSRYEVVKILGWPDTGKSYRRIEEAIKRWVGVTLYYDNAWWNKENGEMITKTFHVIEEASFTSRETKQFYRAKGKPELGLSSFKWNEVVFRSFQAGSLKRLDIDAYFSLESAVTKRMYRFLDKRFWIKPRWEFDLKDFAFEHIGLSRSYDVGQIKTKLQPAIDELSTATPLRAAFIEPMAPSERYEKVGKGRWLVRFERKKGPALPTVAPPLPKKHEAPQGLAGQLVAHGVTPDVAQELVKSRSPEFVALRIEVFEWALGRKDQKIIKENPTGYLIASIRDEYLSVPKGFTSRAEREKRLEAEREKREREKTESLRKQREAAREKEIRRRVSERWEAMSAKDREALNAKALAALPEEERQGFEALAPVVRSAALTSIRREYLRRLIELEEAS